MQYLRSLQVNRYCILALLSSMRIWCILSGWLSGVRYGSYKPYLQVKLGNMTRITAVALEYPTSLSASSTRVSSYALLYGSDGTNWKTAEVVGFGVYYSYQNSRNIVRSKLHHGGPRLRIGHMVQNLITNHNLPWSAMVDYGWSLQF